MAGASTTGRAVSQGERDVRDRHRYLAKHWRRELADSKLVVDCLHGALVRNYPDMTRADVADLVDLGNMEEVMTAVMKRSGLVSAQEANEAGKLAVTTS